MFSRVGQIQKECVWWDVKDLQYIPVPGAPLLCEVGQGHWLETEERQVQGSPALPAGVQETQRGKVTWSRKLTCKGGFPHSILRPLGLGVE